MPLEVLMSYFPVFVDLRGRRCLVVGGGLVAERKVCGLREAEAAVTVVAPALTDRLRRLAGEGEIRHVPREYRPGDLIGASLAMVAVDDRRVGAAVQEEARARRIWVNAADEPAQCDFILPSILRRGPLVIAVATGGRSPALSRAVREWLEAMIPRQAAALAAAAARARAELRRTEGPPSAEAWQAALAPEIHAWDVGLEHDILARLVAALAPSSSRPLVLDEA